MRSCQLEKRVVVSCVIHSCFDCVRHSFQLVLCYRTSVGMTDQHCALLTKMSDMPVTQKNKCRIQNKDIDGNGLCCFIHPAQMNTCQHPPSLMVLTMKLQPSSFGALPPSACDSLDRWPTTAGLASGMETFATCKRSAEERSQR